MTPSVFSQTSNQISSTSKAVLNTLLYFDIFHHPLTQLEIHQYLQNKNASIEETTLTLNKLVQEGFIKNENGLFSISAEHSKIVERRKKGEMFSKRSLNTAKKYSKLIASFPFVQAVFLSGSISKGYMDIESDIDYFIVTSPGRLWLCRTLLIGFKKLFLFNSRKNFCLNYFVSIDKLEIPDRNIFTATELVSVIPTFNYPVYQDFINQNSWTQNFLPNIYRRQNEYCVNPSNFFIKKTFEKVLNGQIGKVMDRLCYSVTLKFWKRKFSNLNDSDFNHRFRSSKNVSKHHPLGYQFKVLEMFYEKIKIFELKNGIELS